MRNHPNIITKYIYRRQYLFFIVAFYLSFSTLNSHAQTEWQETKTVDEVCTTYPERMKTMLKTLNLDLDGLKKVKEAYEKDNIPLACKYLLDYYKEGNSAEYLRKKQPLISQKTNTEADSIISDIFVFYKLPDLVPRDKNGHLNWAWSGPDNDIEWAWALNRHYPIGQLLDTYFETGNPKYAKYIDILIKDWVISSWPYPSVKSSTAMWRGLEVSFRVKVWTRVFYGLMNTGYISPATQLLILSSLPEHSHYARNYHAQNNWLTMEMTGLATIATAWPEFRESKDWLDYTIATMTESLKKQVYADGVQTELTSGYHYVALINFIQFQELCKNANEPLPGYFDETLEKMYDYLAFTMRPDGYGILNNDADRKNNRQWIMGAVEKYKRNDWEYIATNGKSGIKPNGGPSFIFPWAGHLISRSSYDYNALWSFFDIGPWGSGHQHNDKLHISVSAFGRDLLVDGGRFAYRGKVANKFREYARGSQSHNVILFDGRGQAPGPKLSNEPLSENHFKITDEFDYAWNSFDRFNDLEGDCKHTRVLFYIRGNFWVVVDQIATNRPRKIETLWHWHPDCKVKVDSKKITYSENEKGNLQIIPVDNPKWNVSLIKGQEKPGIQGWYSESYNLFEPNIVTIYSSKIKSSSTLVWVLFPSEGTVPNIQTEILSQDADAVIVKVINMEEGEWIVTIPFSDSAKAMLKSNLKCIN